MSIESGHGNENVEKTKRDVNPLDLENQDKAQKLAKNARELGDTEQAKSTEDAEKLLTDLNGNGKIDYNDVQLQMFEADWNKGFNTIKERRDYLIVVLEKAKDAGQLEQLHISLKNELDARHKETFEKGGVQLLSSDTGDLTDMYKLITNENYHIPGYKEITQTEFESYKAQILTLNLNTSEGKKEAIKIIDTVNGHVDGNFYEICTKISNGKITPDKYREWKRKV